MSTKLLFLLPSPRKATTSLEELISRHQIYVRKFIELQKTAPTMPWVIIGDNLVNPLKPSVPDLQLKFVGRLKFSLLRFPYKAIRIMKRSHFKPDLIVAGDSYLTAIFALMIQRIYAGDAQIQLSIHGEVGALTNRGMKSRVKYFLTKVSFDHANILRFVSNQQMEGFSNKFNLRGKKLLVTPVPINIQSMQSSVTVRDAIAFVGRIQQERGVSEWIDITKAFPQEQLMVIGDGPLATRMKSELPKAIFTGLLSNQEVQKK